ncbi:MAG: hypothetical protein JWN39_4110 [Ilumatobacteraceae bacterium]|nr:hypothetical protein [Ilumatobacteraceae bacterium]
MRLPLHLDHSQRAALKELAQRRQSTVPETLDAALEALRRDEAARAAAMGRAADPMCEQMPVDSEMRRRSDRKFPLVGLAVILAIDALVIWVLTLIF